MSLEFDCPNKPLARPVLSPENIAAEIERASERLIVGAERLGLGLDGEPKYRLTDPPPQLPVTTPSSPDQT